MTRTIPLWRLFPRRYPAPQLAAPTPPPPLPRRPRRRPRSRIDVAAAVQTPPNCIMQRDPDSGLWGWVYG